MCLSKKVVLGLGLGLELRASRFLPPTKRATKIGGLEKIEKEMMNSSGLLLLVLLLLLLLFLLLLLLLLLLLSLLLLLLLLRALVTVFEAFQSRIGIIASFRSLSKLGSTITPLLEALRS